MRNEVLKVQAVDKNPANSFLSYSICQNQNKDFIFFWHGFESGNDETIIFDSSWSVHGGQIMEKIQITESVPEKYPTKVLRKFLLAFFWIRFFFIFRKRDR